MWEAKQVGGFGAAGRCWPGSELGARRFRQEFGHLCSRSIPPAGPRFAGAATASQAKDLHMGCCALISNSAAGKSATRRAAVSDQQSDMRLARVATSNYE